MTIDTERLIELIDRICDRYSAAELVEILEDLNLISVREIAETFQEQLIEAIEYLD